MALAMHIDAELEQAGVNRLYSALRSANHELGMSVVSSIGWVARTLMGSLAARTRKAPPRRKIKNAKGEQLYRRTKAGQLVESMAQYYVERYGWQGEVERVPLEPFLSTPFKSHTTEDMLARDWRTGAVHRVESWKSGRYAPSMKRDLKSHPAVKIRKAGLAKESWKWGQKNVNSGGYASIMGVRKVMSVQFYRGADNPQIRIENKLRYVRQAMAPGALNDAVNAAAKSMEWKIGEAVKKAAARVAA